VPKAYQTFVAVFARWLRTLPDACIRDELGKIKILKATLSHHRCNKDGNRAKNRKHAYFLKGIKRQNRCIDSFIKELSIGIALIVSFFLNGAHHCWESNYIHPDQLQPVKNSIKDVTFQDCCDCRPYDGAFSVPASRTVCCAGMSQLRKGLQPDHLFVNV
jgi:hypothetical protein